MNCIGCGGELELGYIPDSSHHNVWLSHWHRGDPAQAEKTFWESAVSGGGVRYDKQKMVPMQAWRCTSCGRVELYARG